MRNGGAAPSRGTIYCLERLLSVAGRDAPATMRAGYDRVLPAALTSLVALSGFGDVSDDNVMEALLQQMQQALGTPQGIGSPYQDQTPCMPNLCHYPNELYSTCNVRCILEPG